ncbi:hypothetical protein [Salinimicrobium oceani]|uniref:Secreted protein n=1 Tax=Salinimicrobium oceani TaxID=2722702 RepID=A0ABX1CYI1_9FLAO|nr:hypothetical protein [Salinimicrobium oceani]NJW53322.1 hypothetical protein [Salinimicrobium oceani]
MQLWQKIFLVCCTGLIIFPSALDLAHIFAGHKHDYCNHYAESHFHEKTVDCDLFDFQKQVFYFPPFPSGEIVNTELTVLPPKREYLYLSTFQKLHFSLRAPPVA